MNTTHEPDPVFVQHLQWQLETELRRQRRFGAGAAPQPGRGMARRGRFARSSALVLASLVIGGAVVVAAERYQERGEREVYEARAAMQWTLARGRAEWAGDERVRIETGYAQGIQGELELIDARVREELALAEVDQRALDFAEVRASGRAARDELSAPVVAGTDYVSARLEIERNVADAEGRRVRARLERIQILAEVGRASAAELARAEDAAAEVEGRRELLEIAQGWRTRFREGEIRGPEADRGGELAKRDAELASLRRRLVSAQGALTRMEALGASGMVAESEVRAARLGVEELEGSIFVGELECELLRAGSPR